MLSRVPGFFDTFRIERLFAIVECKYKHTNTLTDKQTYTHTFDEMCYYAAKLQESWMSVLYMLRRSIAKMILGGFQIRPGKLSFFFFKGNLRL